MTPPESLSRRWYREPMVWLVLAIPFATVIAGVATLTTAVRAGNVDAVIDPVKRTGRVQEFNMAGDRAAARLGLSAAGRVSAETGALTLRIEGDLPPVPQLRITFAHPVRTSEDRTTTLVTNGSGVFLGRTGITTDHDWNLLLTPPDGSWRLVGRFHAQRETFELEPALPEG